MHFVYLGYSMTLSVSTLWPTWAHDIPIFPGPKPRSGLLTTNTQRGQMGEILANCFPCIIPLCRGYGKKNHHYSNGLKHP